MNCSSLEQTGQWFYLLEFSYQLMLYIVVLKVIAVDLIRYINYFIV